MPKYIRLCVTDCPVFEVKAKINVSVHSGVIYRPNRLTLTQNGSYVARTRFDDSTKNQTSNTWISWLNMQILYFFVPRKGGG